MPYEIPLFENYEPGQVVIEVDDLTVDEAGYREFVKRLLENDVNFHPDDPFTDYVDEAGNMTFGAEQAQKLDDYMEAVFGALGDRVYDIGLEMMNAMRPEIDAGAEYRENEAISTIAEGLEELKTFLRDAIEKYPDKKDEIMDLYALCRDEIEDGGSEQHEAELCMNSVAELIGK